MTDSTIPQSHSAIKRQARLDNQGQKHFGGKLDNFENNRERHFFQRMLKAYLKGGTSFQFGFEKYEDGQIKRDLRGNSIPARFNVALTDKTIDANKLDALLANGYNDPGKVFGGASNNKAAIRKAIKERTTKLKADNKGLVLN